MPRKHFESSKGHVKQPVTDDEDDNGTYEESLMKEMPSSNERSATLVMRVEKEVIAVQEQPNDDTSNMDDNKTLEMLVEKGVIAVQGPRNDDTTSIDDTKECNNTSIKFIDEQQNQTSISTSMNNAEDANGVVVTQELNGRTSSDLKSTTHRTLNQVELVRTSFHKQSIVSGGQPLQPGAMAVVPGGGTFRRLPGAAHAAEGIGEEPSNNSYHPDDPPEMLTAIEGAVLADTAEQTPDVEQGSTNHQEVIEGRAMQELNNQQVGKQRRFFAFLATLALLGGIAISAVFLLSNGEEISATKTGTLSKTPTIYPPHREGLSLTPSKTPTIYPPYSKGLSLTFREAINDTDSSHYKANAWMWEDPYMETYSPEIQYQRFLLVAFFFQLDGHNWYRRDHWLSYNVSECEWFSYNSSLGIYGWHEGMDPEPQCDENGHLTAINLTSNNLRGTIGAYTHGLGPFLRIFDVSNNQIDGPTPSVTESAQNLEVFIVSNNNMTGGLTGGGGLVSLGLRVVRLDYNNFHGYYPHTCFVLPNLEVITLSGNLYGQTITPLMRHCKNLTLFDYSNNLYEGTIPSELALLTKLREFDVSGNTMMTGTIPTQFGLLPDLHFLGIDGSGIHGQVPNQLCKRENEMNFQLDANCSLVDCCAR